MSAIASPPIITDAMKKQFQEEGYFILERALGDHYLELLRGECQIFIDKIHAEMDRQKTDVLFINHRGKRYFIANRWHESDRLHEFLFSDLMAEICKATLGPDAYLFVEQYVLKAAEVGMKFAWHQDSGYLGPQTPHKPYLSCWCALDDMSVENGTIDILPFSRYDSRETQQHVQEKGTNDMVGYFGDDPGIPVIVPAGSIVVFSSRMFHRSGANKTKNMRRVYLAQYSCEPIYRNDGSGQPWGMAVPFLKDGKNVFQRPAK
jgi:ectoine hydroxylase-related dioxygenase (phytanoyl-CoA dioxygenase family)